MTVNLDEIQRYTFEFLSAHPLGVGEYELLKHLESLDCFVSLKDCACELTLFKKHFLVMHALYLIRKNNRSVCLSISPLKIVLRQTPPQAESVEVGQLKIDGDVFLEEYYLNLDNFNSATEESVAALNKAFWQRYSAWLNGGESLHILGLEHHATWEQIQITYRKLAQSHHPDKGGDPEMFSQIQEAYETLKHARKPS